MAQPEFRRTLVACQKLLIEIDRANGKPEAEIMADLLDAGLSPAELEAVFNLPPRRGTGLVN